MIIAIDGPAGSGKSTVARALAQRLGFRYLDTGAMYRAVAVRARELGVPLDDAAALARIAHEEPIEFVHERGSALPTSVLIAGRDVTAAIRTAEADDAVSMVAATPAVRAAMLEQQRRIGAERDIVVEGRDIGSVVFPDAEVKVFLTASEAVRAARRAAERGVGDATVVREAMARRDRIDSTRPVAPLAAAEGAVVIDTTDLGIEEVLDRIEDLVQGAAAGERS